MFQSGVNRHVCDVINFMINVILSYGDVVMNISLSFSSHFADKVLNMSEESFQNALSSIYRVVAFNIILQAFFYFLITCLHKLKYVQSV